MLESSHFQKWLKATISTELFRRIVIIPSDYPVNKLNAKSLGIKGKQRTKLTIFNLPISKKLNNYIFRVLDIVFGVNWRALVLLILITLFRPSIVHFHELQHGGYIYNSKFFRFVKKRKYKVICSSWGSDLIFYGKLASHELSLRHLLSKTDVLTAEREVEIEIARTLNYSNLFLAPLYNTIGARIEPKMLSSKPSERKIILIKGYQDNHGRALNALAALTMIEEHLFPSTTASRILKGQ